MYGVPSVKAHCLPFSQIPHSTRLFIDFLEYSPKVQPFYPRSPYLHEWLQQEAGNIRYDASRRERIANILERQNRSWNASSKALANIDRLRKGAVAIVTGQQVGLFGGPMFSVYKALSAVKFAEEATAAGVDAVPIFWLATYDHDLAEVNHIALPNAEGGLTTLTTSSRAGAAAPVSAVQLGEEILPVVEQAAALLGDSEATRFLREAYRPGETLGSAFARLYCKLFADWGVIVLDASDAELHRVAEPVYRVAVERAGELAAALVARGEELESAGYHQQVKVGASSVLLFMLHNGARSALQRHANDSQNEDEFVIAGEGTPERLSRADMLWRVSSSPEQFSPNVLLRPVVQDYLLPTLACIGGPAEAAYFAQCAVVYEALSGRVTPFVPRFSATIVDPKLQRKLERNEITVLDVFAGAEALRKQLASKNLPADLQAAFEAAKNSLAANLSTLKEALSKLDLTLVDAAETSISKMQHQLEKLHAQAARAEAQKTELVARHAEVLSALLYPNKGLQERGIGAIYFMARYGSELMLQIHDTIHSDCHEHQILEL
jgi:bacillithiol synthase